MSADCILDLRFTIGMQSDEPSSFIVEYEGSILSGDDLDEKVGTFEALAVDLDAALEAGHSHLDIMDSYTAQLAQFLRLFGRNGFLPSIARIAETYVCPLLVLQRMEIALPHRGRGLGLRAIEIACQKLGMGCGLAALHAFPIQWEGIDEANDRIFIRDRAKLVSYYARAGFVKTRFPGFMVMQLPREPGPAFHEVVAGEGDR